MEIDPQQPLTPPPEHIKARESLRVAGVVVAGFGVVVFLVGLSGFVSALTHANDLTHKPNILRIFLMFPGLLMIGVGGQMCLLGWAGSIAKYGVREGVPASVEGVNRVALGAAQGVRAVAGAVAAGLQQGVGVPCGACGETQDADARFCDACGKPMRPGCGSCGAAGRAGDRFCARCGSALG